MKKKYLFCAIITLAVVILCSILFYKAFDVMETVKDFTLWLGFQIFIALEGIFFAILSIDNTIKYFKN